MSRKLSAYNMHVASYLRAHPGMDRKQAFRAAAASWTGKGTVPRSEPAMSNPANGEMIKWLALGVAAYLLLPKLVQGMQGNGANSNVKLLPYSPTVRL